jgi:hypothetical protein
LVHEDGERAERERKVRVRKERKKKKKRNLKEQAAARVPRVLFFLFNMLMRVSAGQVGYLQGKNVYTRNLPRPYRLDKIQLESIQKHSKSRRVGTGQCGFAGWAGFCPALPETKILASSISMCLTISNHPHNMITIHIRG